MIAPRRNAGEGAEWGRDGDLAFEREMAVRDALIEAALPYGKVGSQIEKHPDSVRASMSPIGRQTLFDLKNELNISTWEASKPDSVLVLPWDRDTRAKIWDVTYQQMVEIFDEALATLNRDWVTPGYEWFWDLYAHGLPGMWEFSIGKKPWRWKRKASGERDFRAHVMSVSVPGYADYRDTGYQDCGNVFDQNDFDIEGGGTPEQIVARSMAQWEEDGLEDGWLEQNLEDLEDEGRDPDQAYAAWKMGYAACAAVAIRRVLDERSQEDNPPRPRCPIDHAALKRDRQAWAKLKYVGVQKDEDDEGNDCSLEMRDCSCGSTLCVPVAELKDNASGSYELHSDAGLEGVFADPDDAEHAADELRRSGVRDVEVKKRRPRAHPTVARAVGYPSSAAYVEAHRNPATFTAKGDRMYEDIKRGYQRRGEPRAKEIAARTVYARAGEGVRGVVHGNPARDREQAIMMFRDLIRQPGIDSMNIAQDLLLEHELRLGDAAWADSSGSPLGGAFILSPIDRPADGPITEVHWRVHLYGAQAGGAAGNSTFEIQVFYPAGSGGTMQTTYRSPSFYSDAEAARRVAIADAWVIARMLKTLPEYIATTFDLDAAVLRALSGPAGLEATGDIPRELFGPHAKRGRPATYAEARSSLLDELESRGWSVRRNLKVPHATAPHGQFRLWFRPQAIHYTRGGQHSLGNARSISYDLDIRKMSPSQFMSWLHDSFREASA